MTDEMERHWKKPDHVSADQYHLWAVERVWGHLFGQCNRLPDGSVELSDAAKIVSEIVEPMRRKVEEQGFDGFDAFLMRHRCPAPEFGPHPQRPNLTNAEAEKWWSLKTPKQRYAACSGEDSETYDEHCPVVLVGFGEIGKQVARVSVLLDWKDIAESERSILVGNMRKGWVRMPETFRPY